MHWLIKCRAKPAIDELRAATLPAHTKFLDGYAKETWYSGPIFTDDNKNALGSLRLIEFPDREAANTYINADPYTKAGIFQSIAIERWMPRLEVRQRDYPRKPDTLQFVIHAHDQADGSARRAPLREAHEAYLKRHEGIFIARGPLLDDAGERSIGSLIMLDVANKAEAEAFWANEPFNRAGVYEWVTMERWRFGHV
ncbi:MAG: hypothetical protein FJY56_02395 [Betaproteobacteria bacterium]|nr:hypothetical protein [Betaproteobacteria bacterium]